jgi:hypothetical protein
MGRGNLQEVGAELPQLRRQRAARRHRVELGAQVRELVGEQRTRFRLLAHLDVPLVTFVRSVRNAVRDGFVNAHSHASGHSSPPNTRDRRHSVLDRSVCGWWRFSAMRSGSTWTSQKDDDHDDGHDDQHQDRYPIGGGV